MPVKLKVAQTSSGIRNVFARMPFRFGVITMRAAPLLTLAVEIEDAGGRRATGYAADFLAYRWFDKRPEKSLADNCDDLIRSVHDARDLYLDAGSEGSRTPFELWHATHPEIEARALARGFNRLGASFGASMLERGVIDALGRMTGRTYAELVQGDALGIDLGAMSDELRGRRMSESLPARPLERLHVRHTVGLVDPITAIDNKTPVGDGLPETLQDVIERYGHRWFKLKVGGEVKADVERLSAIAAVLDRIPEPYRASFDGNEQYEDVDGVLELWSRIKKEARLKRLAQSVVFIEQPIKRQKALAADVSALAKQKPVIIDESDDSLDAFPRAKALGYQGVSSKTCKGIYKSLINAARCAEWGEGYFMSGEDLTVQAGLALQQDLALVSLLGLTHVERNAITM
jgi:hypothetical protein